MSDFTALLGIDWGTHSSKWLWKIAGDDGSAREGRFKILRSDVRLENGALAGCGKRFLKVASDIAIVSCDMSTGANITD
jgi:hypothetical protein